MCGFRGSEVNPSPEQPSWASQAIEQERILQDELDGVASWALNFTLNCGRLSAAAAVAEQLGYDVELTTLAEDEFVAFRATNTYVVVSARWTPQGYFAQADWRTANVSTIIEEGAESEFNGPEAFEQIIELLLDGQSPYVEEYDE